MSLARDPTTVGVIYMVVFGSAAFLIFGPIPGLVVAVGAFFVPRLILAGKGPRAETHERHPAGDWPFDQAQNVAAVSDAFVVDDRAPILLVVHYSDDDSWGFFSGKPFSPEHGKVIGMGTALRLDPSLRSIADLQVGWRASRPDVGSDWTRRVDPDV